MLEVARKIDWRATPLSSAETGCYSGPGAPTGIRQRSICHSRLKRLTDVAGAAIGLVILLPFLALVGLIVILESRGAMIFRQHRSGLNGKIFTIYKFRTMTVMEDDANIVQATRGDNRVTRVGRFLRRSNIDELPQLINVLKGEMSLVGPRPHAVAHDQYYTQLLPSYHLRFRARPGITGMAQVAGFRGEVRDIAHMQARVTRDLDYIENWSLAMDARILFLTVTTAPFHPSAY